MVSADISSSRAQSLQTARDLLTGLGLGRKLHLKPDALSGGEKQRVAIARALLGNPQILLADEPTASLDAATGKRICEILRDATLEHRRTLVVVSHDPRWIPFADRIVDLEDGKVTDDRRTDPCAFTSERGTAPSSLLGSPSAVHS
jgi:putative ABC transport system ATP-binding protein